MSNKPDTKKQEDVNFKIDDLKQEINSLASQYNQLIAERDKAEDMAKRCLGAIETIQKLIGKDEENA